MDVCCYACVATCGCVCVYVHICMFAYVRLLGSLLSVAVLSLSMCRDHAGPSLALNVCMPNTYSHVHVMWSRDFGSVHNSHAPSPPTKLCRTFNSSRRSFGVRTNASDGRPTRSRHKICMCADCIVGRGSVVDGKHYLCWRLFGWLLNLATAMLSIIYSLEFRSEIYSSAVAVAIRVDFRGLSVMPFKLVVFTTTTSVEIVKIVL